MEKEKKDNRQNAPKGHRVKWYEIPSVIVVLLFLVPPVGLVLLGNSKKTNIVWKLLIGVLVFAIFAYVGSQYKLTKNTNEELSTLSIEQIEYSEVLITFENSAVSMNGKEVSASSDEKFLKVLYTINNSGSEEIYYISMLDDPCVKNLSGERILPDLSISEEPFGMVLPGESKTGFLFFRFPKTFLPENFLIRDFLFKIYEQN